MTVSELYKNVLGSLDVEQIHPLHRAMLEECCENVLEGEGLQYDLAKQIKIVQIAFFTCDSTLKSTLKASLEASGAEQVNLNYRNQTFVISEDSPFLK